MARKPTGTEQRRVATGDGAERNDGPRDTFKQSRLPVANKAGVVHLHINPAQPEAAELQRHVEGMSSTNTDHHGADAPVFNPSIRKR